MKNCELKFENYIKFEEWTILRTGSSVSQIVKMVFIM